MKKFISALSSLVIAATAMGGALAVSSDAATNGTVESTIIAFRSGDDKAEKVEAAAGTAVPVTIYIPQSSGFNTLSVKMAINGKETLGKGTVEDNNGKKYENFPGSFGNYGITISDVTWPKQKAGCLESGILSGNKMFAGYVKTDMTFFTADAFNLSYQAKHAIQYNNDLLGAGSKNMDAYAPYEEAGSPAYTEYTPVFTWTEDEAWAYKYPFVNFNLNLPSDLPDGTYVLDVYYDEYLNTNPTALFDLETNEKLPESKQTFGSSGASGASGDTKLTSKALTIQVGEPTVTTTVGDQTTAPSTQTTPNVTTANITTEAGTPIGGDTIVYNLVPQGKDYTAAPADATGNNIYNATPGEKIKIDWTVANDKGTAGMQMYFDFSAIAAAGGKYDGGEQGDAYMVIPTFNDDFANVSKTENAKDGGQVIYSFAGTEVFQADANGLLYTFSITAPTTPGTYTIVQDSRNKSKVVPLDESKPYDFTVHGLAIVVGSDETTAAVTTTTQDVTTVTSTTVVTTTLDVTTAPITTTTKTTTEPGTILYGDVNVDGEVKINDVVLLNRWFAKTATVSDQGLKNADADANGSVNAEDATAIKEYLARLIAALPKKA